MSHFVTPGFYGFCYTSTGHADSTCPNSEKENVDDNCERCNDRHMKIYGVTMKEMFKPLREHLSGPQCEHLYCVHKNESKNDQ